MVNKIFIGKKVIAENPINDIKYQQLLGLPPTLSNEISRNVKDILFEDIVELNKEDIVDNSGIIDQQEIEKAKIELINKLEELENLSRISKRIIVIVDSCFTNTRLLILLRKILGKDNFKRFVKVVKIDYTKPADNDYLEENLAHNNSLFILGGSLSDTYSIDESFYKSYLSEIIKDTLDEYAPVFLNKRFLGICFGQQYLANIVGITNKNSSGVIATIKGPAQFAPSNCHINKLKYVNSIYQELMKGLSNNGTNKTFSSYFTRSGYVSFDLLKTHGNLGITPLINDITTGGTVGWGSNNGKICGVQFHPELSFLDNKVTLRKDIRSIVPYLSGDKEEQEKYLENFELNGHVKRDIGEAFYVFAILGYIKDILNVQHQTQAMLDFNTSSNNQLQIVPNILEKLICTISKRVGYDIISDGHLSDEDINRNWLDSIDKKGGLLLNYLLDWKVNRSLGEVSEILGIKSIVDLIQEHKGIQNTKNYIIRDLGAGDGNTIKELHTQLEDSNTVIYGIGDYIYFDLFSAINNTHFKESLPEELRILFVEKVIQEFKILKSDTTIEKIKQAIYKIELSKTDTIQNSSMTNKKTLMFENENESHLSQELIENFDKYTDIISELEQYIVDNIYELFSGFYKRIYISKFNDLHIDDEVVSKTDFQYAIRSTSHVSGREYMKIIYDYFFNSAKPGSIYIDNGIHQSYTGIPRLKELNEVSYDFFDGDCKLIYDENTNYFCSVIITKKIKLGNDFWDKHLGEGKKLVSVSEAYKSTFFKLEYFLRNFIIANFKNHGVFWDFNNQIVYTLKLIMSEINNKNTTNIGNIILELINYIAENYKNKQIIYNKIDLDILNSYKIDGEKLHDILDKEVYIPDWMVIDANRKY